jgi:hypothetical protein
VIQSDRGITLLLAIEENYENNRDLPWSNAARRPQDVKILFVIARIMSDFQKIAHDSGWGHSIWRRFRKVRFTDLMALLS